MICFFFPKRVNQDSNVPSARRLLPEKFVGETEIDPLEQRKTNNVSEKKVVILTRICKTKKCPIVHFLDGIRIFNLSK